MSTKDCQGHCKDKKCRRKNFGKQDEIRRQERGNGQGEKEKQRRKEELEKREEQGGGEKLGEKKKQSERDKQEENKRQGEKKEQKDNKGPQKRIKEQADTNEPCLPVNIHFSNNYMSTRAASKQKVRYNINFIKTH